MGNTILVTGVGREDKGMYQCVVRRQDGDTFQAAAELQLGGMYRQICVHFLTGRTDPPIDIELGQNSRSIFQINIFG